MDNNLIKKLQEDLFQPVTHAEKEQRRKERPLFKCPSCNKEILYVTGRTQIDNNFEINGSGEVGDVYDLPSWPEQPSWEYFCPLCKEDITDEVSGA